ncbi:MAG: beta-ketoacyl-ACP synthase III [Gammaproteobacteria bacterium]|nr:beta-ketoacyl-ACP synthase III [Gammaproteobacteria bacterium]
MTTKAYITDIARFLPNAPVDNEQIETVLGNVNCRPSRSRKIVLRNNGIQTRYYAIDPATGLHTHTNAQLAAEAVRALAKKSGFDLNRLELLCAGTASPDLVQPSHGAMVHGELGTPPCEVFTSAAVCTSSMSALRYAMMSIEAGYAQHAISIGSEFPSRYMRGRNFSADADALVDDLEKRPELAFEKDFLRWMLSDGAGAALLRSEPNRDRPSLRIDWMDMISQAGDMPVCMYAGGNKRADGSMQYWHETEDPLDIVRQSFYALKQDARILNEYIIPASIDRALIPVAKRHNLKPDDIDWFLPHYSSEYFRERLHDRMVQQGFDIPLERWFTNLTRVGNIGAAAMYLILDELLDSGRLKTGDRLLCYIPESARFNFCYMHLTVV